MPKGNRTARRGIGPPRSTLRSVQPGEIVAFRQIAAQHGYTNEFQFFIGITSGECATVLLDEDDRRDAVAALLASDNEVLQSIGRQLLAAQQRNTNADGN